MNIENVTKVLSHKDCTKYCSMDFRELEKFRMLIGPEPEISSMWCNWRKDADWIKRPNINSDDARTYEKCYQLSIFAMHGQQLLANLTIYDGDMLYGKITDTRCYFSAPVKVIPKFLIDYCENQLMEISAAQLKSEDKEAFRLRTIERARQFFL